MGEGRNSGSREMRGGSGGGEMGLQSMQIDLMFCSGFCLWCNNFHFVLCAILASWDDVLFFYCIIFSFVSIIK